MTKFITFIDTSLPIEWYGGFERDFDCAAVDAEYEEALNDVMPEGVTLRLGGVIYATEEAIKTAGSRDLLTDNIWDAINFMMDEKVNNILQRHERTVVEALTEDDDICNLVAEMPEGYRVVQYATKLGDPGAALVRATPWLDGNGVLHVSDTVFSSLDDYGEVQVGYDPDGLGYLYSPIVLGQAETPTELYNLLIAWHGSPNIWEEWEDAEALNILRIRDTANKMIQERHADSIALMLEPYFQASPEGWDICCELREGHLVFSQSVPQGWDEDGLVKSVEVEAVALLDVEEWKWMCDQLFRDDDN